MSLLLLAGCATRTEMSLGKDEDTISTDAPPIYLMTATFKNSYRTWFQPRLLVVNVEKPEARDKSEHLSFMMDDKARDEKDTAEEGNRYFLRLALPAGDYIVRGFTGYSGHFPISAIYFAPLHVEVKSSVSGIHYLGHITATVRERRENEFKAGPSIPLIDQAVAGFSGGTFDIDVSDRLDADRPEFLAKFPALRTAKIQKSLLAPFDRSKAQKYWEAN